MKDLTQQIERNWESRWPGDSLFWGTLDETTKNRWVRFHTLPESKRYPDTEEEYETVISRHNTILTELDPGESVVLVTSQWSNKPDDPKLAVNETDPSSELWFTIFESPDETDPEFFTYRYVYISKKAWKPGVVDAILRAVANDEIAGVMLAPVSLEWLYYPYDGGMDIYCASSAQRDELKDRHSDWLSSHPKGF